MTFRPQMQQLIEGAKSGAKKQHTPVESPDSIASIDYIKILLALGEGEWEGGVTERDIYLNNTPLANEDGTLNFPNVKWEFRPGTIDQDYIQGIPSIDNEVEQNVELKFATPFTYSATNQDLSALRVRIQFESLYAYKDNGDMVGTKVEYAIDLATGSGSFQQVHQGMVDDKTTTTYSRSIRIDLPPFQAGGWRLRVRRLTPDSTSPSKLGNATRIASVAEVIDAKMAYPNTALLFVQFDASMFSSTPQISVLAKGRKVRVPSNYNPETRTYNGAWDGTFVYKYTSNPVWHWYDIVLNRRFGLGRRIDATMVNKWSLYRISQYCDQPVSNGLGGTEPRFTCNVYMQSQQEAWNVLRDISAIFRGMTYWDGSSMVLDADMPADVVYTFSPSNVKPSEAGQYFEYTSSAWKDRYTLSIVRWDNPATGYQTQPKPVPNTKAQIRYGVRQTELSAIGCTSESEAQRRGEWTNLTSFYETNIISFTTGVEGRGLAPGKIIAVADPALAGQPLGGRVVSVAGRVITIDRDATISAGDVLRVNLPSGISQERSIVSVNGRAISVVASFTETPVAEAQWSVDRVDLKTQKYRIITIEKADGNDRKITAVQHNQSKFDAVDSGAKIDVPPVTSIPAASLESPQVTVAQNIFTAQGLAVTTMTISWTAVKGAVRYEVEWKRDSGNWVRLGIVNGTSVDVESVYAGNYIARVRAISAMEVYSMWGTSLSTALQGKTNPPPFLAALFADSEIFGIKLRWLFPEGAEDTAYTELQVAEAQDEEGAQSMGLFAYPTNQFTMSGLAGGVIRWFRGRLQDRSGNVGEWSNWVRGMSSANAEIILEYLLGQITESQLGEDLLAQIQKIPGLEDAINNIRNTLEYDPTLAYIKGAIVRFETKLYQAQKDVPADTDGTGAYNPTKPEYWKDVGDIIETANAMATRLETVETSVKEIDGKVTAAVEKTNQMFAQVTPDLAGDDEWYAGDTDITAGNISIQSVMADADMALSSRMDSMTATFNTATSQNYAAILEESTARTTALNALAARTTTLEAKVGDDLDTLRAQVETTSKAVASLNGKASASVVTKVNITANGQHYAAGFAVGLDYAGGELTSQFLVLAQRFAVLNGTDAATATAPFVVQNGQVFINQAFIGNGWITNAMIGNIIQSDTYIPGQQGWAINKSGGFELNGNVPGLGRVQITNNVIQVWYPNGILACRMGIW